MGRPRLKQLSGQGASDGYVATYDSGDGQWESRYPNAVLLTCDTGVAVRDLIYLDGSGVGQKADSDSSTTAPAVAMVVVKPTTTTCLAITYGRVSGFTGLTVGELFLSGTAGGVTSTAPTAGGAVVQSVGWAISTTEVVVKIGIGVVLGT